MMQSRDPSIDQARTLEDIGLTGNEAKVYFSLLKLGQTTTGPIIKDTAIHTSKVYDALQRLEERGIVTHIVAAGRKQFSAASPERLTDLLQERRRRIDEQEHSLKLIIPMLLAQQRTDEETHAEVFSGWKGMETAYGMMRRTLKRGDLNLVFGASRGEDERMVRIFFTKHLDELARKGVKQRIIYNESARGHLAEQSRRPMRFQVRYMKETTPAEINIWADKTMIVILRKKPTVVMITDKVVADSFRKYFEMMWRSAHT